MVVFWIVSIVCCLYFQSCTYLDSLIKRRRKRYARNFNLYSGFRDYCSGARVRHFYFAKKSGILVREFAIGMGPKIFAHIGKDGTAYTIRILPLGGYVRMAGWGDDTTEIKTGTPVSLTLADDGKVKRINLSGKKLDQTALPMQVTQFDFEDKLFIKGLVLEEEKTFAVDHDATVVEADGTEVRIAPLDVQYQNATIWGKLITNFAGPMNNFILGVVVFWVLIFMQGGVRDVDTNQFHIMPKVPWPR